MCQQCFHRNTIQTDELEGLAKCEYCNKIISVECKYGYYLVSVF